VVTNDTINVAVSANNGSFVDQCYVVVVVLRTAILTSITLEIDYRTLYRILCLDL